MDNGQINLVLFVNLISKDQGRIVQSWVKITQVGLEQNWNLNLKSQKSDSVWFILTTINFDDWMLFLDASFNEINSLLFKQH